MVFCFSKALDVLLRFGRAKHFFANSDIAYIAGFYLFIVCHDTRLHGSGGKANWGIGFEELVFN